MKTFVIQPLVVSAAVLLAGGFGQVASAQEQTADPAQVENRAGSAEFAAYTPRGIGDLTLCVAEGGVEVARVSHDVAGGPETWVKLDREKGEVVSTERIDPDGALIGTIQCLEGRALPIG